jgi:hypothetical protein
MPGYYLLEHPTPEQWQALLEAFIPRARWLELAYADRRSPLPRPLQPLEAHLVDVFETCFYWGAQQIRTLRFFRLDLVAPVRAFLQEPPALANWDAPPPVLTDPALYGDDEVPLLWTIAHEDQVYLWLDDQEAEVWRARGFHLTPAPEVTRPW